MSSNLPNLSNDTLFDIEATVEAFWNHYKDSGVSQAGRYFKETVENGGLSREAVISVLVPALVHGGYARDIDMTEAVEQMQTIQVEIEDHADGATHDGGELLADSPDASVDSEDAAGSADTEDADREASGDQ